MKSWHDNVITFERETQSQPHDAAPDGATFAQMPMQMQMQSHPDADAVAVAVRKHPHTDKCIQLVAVSTFRCALLLALSDLLWVMPHCGWLLWHVVDYSNCSIAASITLYRIGSNCSTIATGGSRSFQLPTANCQLAIGAIGNWQLPLAMSHVAHYMASVQLRFA